MLPHSTPLLDTDLFVYCWIRLYAADVDVMMLMLMLMMMLMIGRLS